MLRPQGYATLIVDGSLQKECDTFTCAHCQRIVHVPPRKPPPGGLCKLCMGLTCPRCHAVQAQGGGCTPWEMRMERMERRDRLYAALRF